MNSKVTTRKKIISCFHDGQIIAVGGQAGPRTMPNRLIDCILESGAKHLTIYSIDASDPGLGLGKLIRAGRVDKMITTHIGMNSEAVALFAEGKLEIELSPMGSFIERLRCGGMGLGGVLTKTGLGTVVEEGKQVITVNGEDYLLETALRADVSISRAYCSDTMGNLRYHGTGTASHPIVATCGNISIVECDHLCEAGEMGVDDVRVPGMFVDMILPEEV